MTYLITHKPADTGFIELAKAFRNTFPTVRHKDKGRYEAYRAERLGLEPLKH